MTVTTIQRVAAKIPYHKIDSDAVAAGGPKISWHPVKLACANCANNRLLLWL